MTSRIDDFKTAVVAEIKTKLPNLKECRSLGGRFNLDVLLESGFKAPAVLFSVVKSPIKITASNKISLTSRCAAYIITDGKEEERDSAAWVIAEAIAVMLGNDGLWKTILIGLPEKAEIEPLISAKFRKRGVTLIAVTWDQNINRLGNSLFDDEGVVLSELYINGHLADEIEVA